jgi:hypothetical protein
LTSKTLFEWLQGIRQRLDVSREPVVMLAVALQRRFLAGKSRRRGMIDN